MSKWELDDGVIEFPSGRRVRGRSWKTPVSQDATYTVVLTTSSGKDFSNHGIQTSAQETVTIDWPDDRLPLRLSQASQVLREAWERSAEERVEIVCTGGKGRTGTALAIMAICDGMTPEDAIDFVRENYCAEAIQTHAQRGFLLDFSYRGVVLDSKE